MPPKGKKQCVGSTSGSKKGTISNTGHAPVFVGRPPWLKEEEKVFWDNLTVPSRRFRDSKFLCSETLSSLGMLNVMTQMLRRVGLGGFMTKTPLTYRQLSSEFLATLSLSRPQGGEPEITFAINDEEHSLKYSELRAALGITNGVSDDAEEGTPPATYYPLVEKCTISRWWYRVTKKHPTPKQGDYSSTIPHPCLRLVHRFLAETLLCKGQVGKITKDEMGYLRAMTPEGACVPDWVDMFINGCIATRTAKAGEIGMGGVITLILEYLHIDVPGGFVPVHPVSRFDIPCLVNFWMLKRSNMRGSYIWLGQGKREMFRLPRVAPNEDLVYGATGMDYLIDIDEEFVVHVSSEEDEDEDEDEDESDDNDSNQVEQMHIDGVNRVLIATPPATAFFESDMRAFMSDVRAWMPTVDASLKNHSVRIDEFTKLVKGLHTSHGVSTPPPDS